MLGIYDHTFILPSGKRVFVPSGAGRTRGEEIKTWVAKRWKPPSNFFHLNSGGHVAAAKSHISANIFGKLDLSDFFNTVTRTKAQRSLRKLGFGYHEARSDARDSTVEIVAGTDKFSIPYGFIQSPILASLALNTSALGKMLIRLPEWNVRASVYVDDIILSAPIGDSVVKAMSALAEAATASNFKINQEKVAGPALAIEVFNIVLAHDSLTITDARMKEFVAAIQCGSVAQATGVLGYVQTVNPAQAEYLRSVAEVKFG